MAEFSGNALLAQLRATTLAEWLAVALGVVYVLLILRRSRWGWLAGGISSVILTVLAVRAHLPMQALLQFSYVLAAVYGWWRWNSQSSVQHIGVWQWRGHVLALLACLLASLAMAQLLASEGYSAWPFLDSLVACLGLFATWLLARMYLENWLYWILIDSLSLYLFAVQGLVVTALLFLFYLAIAVQGFRSWHAAWRKGVGAA